jgi:hypothetical protein
MPAAVRHPFTLAVLWTGRQAAVKLVVLLRTLEAAVTQQAGVQTRPGATTTIHTRTAVVLTPLLVLLARAVVDAVTAREVGHAVAVVWALEVSVRARDVECRLRQKVVCVVASYKHLAWFHYLAFIQVEAERLYRDITPTAH